MVSLHTHCTAAPPTHLGFPSPDGFQLRLPLLLTLAKGLNGQLLLVPPPLPPLLAQLVLRHELWWRVALLDGAQHLDFVGIGGDPCSSSVLVPTTLALAFLDINVPCKWRVCQTVSQHTTLLLPLLLAALERCLSGTQALPLPLGMIAVASEPCKQGLPAPLGLAMTSVRKAAICEGSDGVSGE